MQQQWQRGDGVVQPHNIGDCYSAIAHAFGIVCSKSVEAVCAPRHERADVKSFAPSRALLGDVVSTKPDKVLIPVFVHATVLDATGSQSSSSESSPPSDKLTPPVFGAACCGGATALKVGASDADLAGGGGAAGASSFAPLLPPPARFAGLAKLLAAIMCCCGDGLPHPWKKLFLAAPSKAFVPHASKRAPRSA